MAIGGAISIIAKYLIEINGLLVILESPLFNYALATDVTPTTMGLTWHSHLRYSPIAHLRI